MQTLDVPLPGPFEPSHGPRGSRSLTGASLFDSGGAGTSTQLGASFAAAYALVGVIWVLVSDGIVSLVVPTTDGLEAVHRYKSLAFVVVSALCLFFLVRYGYRRLLISLNADTARTIAELKRELEVRVAERTRELSFANQELEAFSRTAAHDLKTPLSGIIGLAEILHIRYKPLLGVEGDRLTSLIRKSATGMAVLIDDLLSLSRVTTHALDLVRVDLAGVAGAVVDELRAQTPGREVTVSIRSPMHIAADEGLLRALLTNLIGNAWKFTERTPTAHIEVGCDDSNAGWVVHFVRDNGAGFDMCDAARVFEPFRRFHSTQEFQGTGVGLATCQRIVCRHGGSIWIKSVPGQGTTVYFSLSQTDVKGHPPCVPKDSFFAAFL